MIFIVGPYMLHKIPGELEVGIVCLYSLHHTQEQEVVHTEASTKPFIGECWYVINVVLLE